MKKFIAISLAVGFFFVSTVSTIWADSVEDEKVVRQHMHKFSRGVVNVGTAPLEIPKQMVKRAQDGKGPGGQLAGYITGAFTGIGWGIWRLGSGIIDVFSAPFPGNEEGKITPEFITDEDPIE